MSQKNKSFLRGYSMIVHSFIMWMFFIATASTGLNILIPGFAGKNGLSAPDFKCIPFKEHHSFMLMCADNNDGGNCQFAAIHDYAVLWSHPPLQIICQRI